MGLPSLNSISISGGSSVENVSGNDQGHTKISIRSSRHKAFRRERWKYGLAILEFDLDLRWKLCRESIR
jgi:hypothetical protein